MTFPFCGHRPDREIPTRTVQPHDLSVLRLEAGRPNPMTCRFCALSQSDEIL